jgi:hypothetical protein
MWLLLIGWLDPYVIIIFEINDCYSLEFYFRKILQKNSKNAFRGILAEAKQTFHHYQNCVISAHMSTKEVTTLLNVFTLYLSLRVKFGTLIENFKGGWVKS